jgi:hypothetical protein
MLSYYYTSTLTHSLLKSDNAANYSSPQLLLSMRSIAAAAGLYVSTYVHTETQDGKSFLDGHFAVVGKCVRRSVFALIIDYADCTEHVYDITLFHHRLALSGVHANTSTLSGVVD